MGWWMKNNLRLVQNNIRETDANLDADLLINKLKEMSANALMLNTGGIVAFYPTELEFHYKNPYLKKDLIGEVVAKCHEQGMRFFARFDFSKAHESIYAKKPEWFFQSRDGKSIHYHDLVVTCVNGYYQREYSLKIIDEVITRYPVDGIFFNMFGYQNRDYSGNYYGLCHCENCRNRFREMFGCELPEEESSRDPNYEKYREFQRITTRMMLDSIYDLVKAKNREIAICTYNEHKVDVVRKESNTEIHRDYPFWLYSGSENVKSVEDSWEDKTISNCCINAVGLDYRFMGVSKHQVAVRLYESIASGSGLDFCIIGPFEGYPDRDNFETVKRIFRFHAENEQYFGHFQSMADLVLIKPAFYLDKAQEKEYLGIFRMLKEKHVQFDVIVQSSPNFNCEKLSKYKVMILPDIRKFTDEDEAVLRDLQKQGIQVIATNKSFLNSPSGESFLQEWFGAKFIKAAADTRSAYLYTQDKKLFKSFLNRDWVFLYGDLALMEYGKEVQKLLPFVSPGIFGPPEKVGGNELTQFHGGGLLDKGDGVAALLPWQVGGLYYQYGYEDHKNILLDILDRALSGRYIVQTNAPKNVEVFLNRCPHYMVQLLNLSGFNGTTFYEPNPIDDIEITLEGAEEIQSVYSLVQKKELSFVKERGTIRFTVPKLDLYDAYILK